MANLAVVPKDLYVGDKAQLTYTFSVAKQGFSGTLDFAATDTLFDSFNGTFCTVLGASLEGHGTEITFTMDFIPWIKGSLIFPPFDLSKQTGLSSFIVKIPEINVLSITETRQITQLQDPAPPVVIPGTSWLLYGGIISGLFLLLAVIVLVLRFKSLGSRLLHVWHQLFHSRRYRICAKKLKYLQKNAEKLSDADFAQELSQCMRRYLDMRFNLPFSAALNIEIDCYFADLMAEQFSEYIEQLKALFLRCDYVRFSGRKDQSARMTQEERVRLLDGCLHTLLVFDGEYREVPDAAL